MESLPQIINIVVFIVVLLLSLSIGIFFSCKQQTTAEYVHGSRNMSLLPVCISLVVTFLSAVTLQGVPAEVYLFGLDIVFMEFGIVIAILLTNVTFLPIYYELKLTSVYEYLEMRYESAVPKVIGCLLDISQHIFYTGILIFGTAVALESLLGVQTEYNILAMTLVCTLYTSLGGLRGVIWTDLFQALIMVCGLITVIFSADLSTNRIVEEFNKREHSVLNLDPSMTQRSSLWMFLFVFNIRTYLAFCDQVAMVRYTGLPSLAKANMSLLLAAGFFVILQGLGFILGIVLYAYYSEIGCGPLEKRDIKSPNQLVPYFVTEVAKFPGFVGLFASAALSATLSTASSAQNAIAAIFLKDIISPFFPNLRDTTRTIILKILVVVFGLLMMVVAFVAIYLDGTVFQISNAVHGVTKAPAFGMFLLGACFTFTSSKAVVTGSITGILFLSWIFIGSYILGTTWEKPNMITDSCFGNQTLTNITFVAKPDNYTAQSNANSLIDMNHSGMIELYSISPYMYHALGVFISFAVGALLSLFPCCRHKSVVDKKLLFPFVRKLLKNDKNCCNDSSLEREHVRL